jgi:hypothetical protein
MEEICRQLWFCGAIPPEWHGFMPFLIPFAVVQNVT